MLVQVIASHIQSLFGRGQHLYFEVFMVVGFANVFFTVMTVPIVVVSVIVVLFLTVVSVFGEVNLTPYLLQVEVAIHVVLEPQNALLAFICAQNHIAACGPAGPIQEPKAAIFIKPKAAFFSIT